MSGSEPPDGGKFSARLAPPQNMYETQPLSDRFTGSDRIIQRELLPTQSHGNEKFPFTADFLLELF